MPDVQAYDIASFAKAHSISRSQTYEEIKSGRLRILKVGRRTLVSREAAEAWRRAHEQAPSDESGGDTTPEVHVDNGHGQPRATR